MPKKQQISREYNEIIKQLENLKDHCSDFARSEGADPIWQQDIKALEEAVDIIADYEAVVSQTNELIKKYETPEAAIKRAPDFYQCPACSKRTNYGHTHCHWCGKLLTYDVRNNKRR